MRLFKIIVITCALHVLIFSFYYIYFGDSTKSMGSLVPMDRQACEANGGRWTSGHEVAGGKGQPLGSCQCRKVLISEDMSPVIKEREMKKCP